VRSRSNPRKLAPLPGVGTVEDGSSLAQLFSLAQAELHLEFRLQGRHLQRLSHYRRWGNSPLIPRIEGSANTSVLAARADK